MREIIFRGQKKCPSWHADYRDWYYGDLVTTDEDYQISTADGIIGTVFADTIGQYTGLKDRNGAKIFEGDIIRFYDDTDGHEDGTIYWQIINCCFAVKWETGIIDEFDDLDATHSEIIGNIFDGKNK